MVNRITESGNNSSISFSIKQENIGRQTISEGKMVTPEMQDTPKNEDLSVENLSSDKVKKMTESLNDFLETTSTKLRYEFHEKLEKYYVTLVDTETDQLVREIPNKKLMDMYASMLDFIGVLIDKKI
ncbi:flagellar protein FlaG [Psychrobacillus psychrotolerans]|uniref:Flagellar protein FlaG n=1 Tax=Psychrobacillus psychrotolerans TaxID=126156 RepID=A0A1I5ZBM7_9BACI|nr:flagellar protein FlaG [Psychrobacillus psychrotolerans]SFQ53527.1 flagellar protein FlaG [Psychrobacillus psychrotolerans]